MNKLVEDNKYEIIRYSLVLFGSQVFFKMSIVPPVYFFSSSPELVNAKCFMYEFQTIEYSNYKNDRAPFVT